MLSIADRDVDLSHSHNVVLDTMRTMGIPGLVAVSIFLIACLFLCLFQFLVALSAKRVSRVERMTLIGLVIGVVSYIVANMSSDSFGPSTSPVFWITLCVSLWQAKKVLVLAEHAAIYRRRPPLARAG